MVESQLVRDGEQASYKLISKKPSKYFSPKELISCGRKYEELDDIDKAADFVLNESLEFLLDHYCHKSFDLPFYTLSSDKALELFHSGAKEKYGRSLRYLEVDLIPENEKRYFSIITDGEKEERLAVKAVSDDNLLSVYAASKINKGVLGQFTEDLEKISKGKIESVDGKLKEIQYAHSIDTTLEVRDPNIFICEDCGYSVAEIDECNECGWTVPRITMTQGQASQDLVIVEIRQLKSEMHQRFDTLDDKIDDIAFKIPDKDEFMKAAYKAVTGDFKGAMPYLKENKTVYAQVTGLMNSDKKIDKMQKAMSLIVSRMLSKELIYEINIDGGTMDGKTYVVGQPFNAEITIQPTKTTILEKIESTLHLNNALYEAVNKPVNDKTVIINEELTPGNKYTTRLEIERPESPLALMLKAYAETEIGGERYPIMLMTNPLNIKHGNVRWTKFKKGLKAVLKFVGDEALEMIGLSL